MENGARPWTIAISTLIQVTLKCLVHSALKLGLKRSKSSTAAELSLQPVGFAADGITRHEDSQSSCRSQQQLFESPTKKKTGRRNRISQFPPRKLPVPFAIRRARENGSSPRNVCSTGSGPQRRFCWVW